MSKETVTIMKEEYDDLVESYQWLCALESAGVDNWCGYDHAQEILKEWEEGEQVKLHIVRRITREDVKEYAMQGMQFSTRTSKAWGLGALKNALWNVIYYRSYLETKENAIMRYVDRVTEGGRLKVDVLVVDIDNVTIEETPILAWCMINLIKERK